MCDLVGNPEDRFSRDEAHFMTVERLYFTYSGNACVYKPLFYMRFSLKQLSIP